MFEIGYGRGYSAYYIAVYDDDATRDRSKYLHSDGVIRDSTLNGESGYFTGYYYTRAEADRALIEYNSKRGN